MLATPRHPAQVQAQPALQMDRPRWGQHPESSTEGVLSAAWKAVASSHCFPESGLFPLTAWGNGPECLLTWPCFWNCSSPGGPHPYGGADSWGFLAWQVAS